MHRPPLLVGVLAAMVALLLSGSVYLPFAAEARERARPVRCLPCLRARAGALLLYANPSAGTTPPFSASVPSTKPTTERSAGGSEGRSPREDGPSGEPR